MPLYPPEWLGLLSEPSIGRLSRSLNNLFSLTALGIDNGHFHHFRTGVAPVTLNGGRTYHRILPSEDGSHAIRWFLFDAQAMFTSAAERQVPPEWVRVVRDVVARVNPYFQSLERLSREGPTDDNLALHIKFPGQVNANEIAAVVSLAPAGPPLPRRYVIKYRNRTDYTYLPHTSPLIEPLHYILLFPFGNPGWNMEKKTIRGKNFSQMRFLRTRYFMNADQMCRFTRLAGIRTVICPDHLFLRVATTGEWLVDAQSMIEESRLTYIRNNQRSTDNDEVEYNDPDGEPTQDIRLPSSFVNSPGWRAANVADCLALRRTYGNATFFLTLTCNTNWPEITSQLRPHQTTSDRPDVVCRAFKARFAALRAKMKLWFGPELYHIYVIEFQKRGLPHAHLIVALKNVPVEPADIQKVLRADIPQEQGPLRDAVLKYMQHEHNPAREVSRCGWPQKNCQYGFPKSPTDTPTLDDLGKFTATRRTSDEWTVMYCPQLLLLWDGHLMHIPLSVKWTFGVPWPDTMGTP